MPPRTLLLIVALLAALTPLNTYAKGGNCKNECESAMGKPFEDCKKAECTQVTTAACSKANNSSDTSAGCKCPTECQACYDDVIGGSGGFMEKSKSKCVGCTDKNGYDFNKDVWPGLRKEAEGMGCNANSSSANTFNLATVFLVVVATYFVQ